MWSGGILVIRSFVHSHSLLNELPKGYAGAFSDSILIAPSVGKAALMLVHPLLDKNLGAVVLFVVCFVVLLTVAQ